MQVLLHNHLNKPLHINIYDHVINISAYDLYKRGENSLILLPNSVINLAINFSDFVYISDAKLYNVYRIIPKFMREFWDGIELHLWDSKPKQAFNNNVTMTKLIPNTNLWYIFDDRVYNFFIIFIAVAIVALIYYIAKHFTII